MFRIILFGIPDALIQYGYYRFTDFLVYEVDLEGNVVHIKDLGKPEGVKVPKAPPPPPPADGEVQDGMELEH